jgi:hypothetical protein
MSDLYYDYEIDYDFAEQDYFEDFEAEKVDRVFDYNFIASILTDRGLPWLTRTIHYLKYSSSFHPTWNIVGLSEGSDTHFISNIARDHGWGWVDAQIILIQGIKFRLSLFSQQLPIDVEPF